MKYYIIAGEASGDLHGANLIRALKDRDAGAVIRCWGGDKMKAAGGMVVKHIKDLAFMGFAEVVKNLPAILRNFSFCKKDILQFHPEVLVLIDYPGFNLRMARWARKQKFKIVYYISPQVWAWKENRVRQIIRDVDRMLVIFPFEKDYYRKWNYDVQYVGHPLVQVVDEFKRQNAIVRKNNIIALLPGSRRQEIKVKLPIMLQVAARFPDYKFLVGKAPSIDKELYSDYLNGFENVTLVNETYPLLMEATAALVTSGTATLETALFGVPEVVCYKTGRISYAIGKRLIKLKFICIVNLIMNREVVKELIQNNLNTENVSVELEKLLYDEKKRAQIFSDYSALRQALHFRGNASQNAADAIIGLIRGERV